MYHLLPASTLLHPGIPKHAISSIDFAVVMQGRTAVSSYDNYVVSKGKESNMVMLEVVHRYVQNERRCLWQKRFSEESLAMFVLVAGTNTELTGFVCVFPEEDGVFGSLLDNLHVTPRLTGQGIGRLLLLEAARRLTSNGTATGLYLWVIEQNVRARRFYEKSGAVVVGSAKNRMPDGQNILALRCYWPKPESLIL